MDGEREVETRGRLKSEIENAGGDRTCRERWRVEGGLTSQMENSWKEGMGREEMEEGDEIEIAD